MGRPGKAVETIDNKVSRRTKADLELRRKGERELLSGVKLFERDSVKNDKIAHKEFLRVSKLFEKIGKCDALYGAVCNRYCELYSEIEQLLSRSAELNSIIDRLDSRIDEVKSSEELTALAKQFTSLIRQVNEVSSLIMQKRKMMFDIEKENCMTVASSIRTIPKTAEKPQENPIIAALADDGEDDEQPERTE